MKNPKTQKHYTYWDILPEDIQRIIIEHRAANTIKRNAYKMFYKIYGISWKEDIQNYEKNLELFSFLTGIYEPPDDYINYYCY